MSPGTTTRPSALRIATRITGIGMASLGFIALIPTIAEATAVTSKTVSWTMPEGGTATNVKWPQTLKATCGRTTQDDTYKTSPKDDDKYGKPAATRLAAFIADIEADGQLTLINGIPEDASKASQYGITVTWVFGTTSACATMPVTTPVQSSTKPTTTSPAPSTTTPETKKVYVCKYVGTPGTNERLQTGQNPIEVSVNSIKNWPVAVGSYFADAQGRSYVLGFVPMTPAPTAASCPAGTPTTPPVTTPPCTTTPPATTTPPVTTPPATTPAPSHTRDCTTLTFKLGITTAIQVKVSATINNVAVTPRYGAVDGMHTVTFKGVHQGSFTIVMVVTAENANDATYTVKVAAAEGCTVTTPPATTQPPTTAPPATTQPTATVTATKTANSLAKDGGGIDEPSSNLPGIAMMIGGFSLFVSSLFKGKKR